MCLKPVNPEEKNCPYCGSKLKKDLLPKLIIGVLLLTLIGSLAIPVKSDLEKKREKIRGHVLDEPIFTGPLPTSSPLRENWRGSQWLQFRG